MLINVDVLGWQQDGVSPPLLHLLSFSLSLSLSLSLFASIAALLPGGRE